MFTVYAAQTFAVVEKIKSQIINPLIGFLFALAFLYFIWGVFGLFDEKKREEAKQHVLYGVIGMFIIVSAFGIIHLICNTVGQTC